MSYLEVNIVAATMSTPPHELPKLIPLYANYLDPQLVRRVIKDTTKLPQYERKYKCKSRDIRF